MTAYLLSDEHDYDQRLMVFRLANKKQLEGAEAEYKKIATALESAVTTLGKVVEVKSDGMKGESIEAIKEDAGHAKEKLAEASERYAVAAAEIGIYLDEFDKVTTEVDAAESAAADARRNMTLATGLPDGVPDDDGVLSAEEEQKNTTKSSSIAKAEESAAAARARLEKALDVLDAAGRRLGGKVSARAFKDSLSDSTKDKILAVFEKISEILSWIGVALGILCIFIPGVAVLLAAAAVVAVMGVVVAGVLYANGKEGLVDLILAVVGVGLLVGGGALSLLGKSTAANLRGAATGVNRQSTNFITRWPSASGARPVGSVPPRTQSIELRPFGPGGPGRTDLPLATATQWKNLSDWFHNPLSNWFLRRTSWQGAVPDVGFWRSSWQQVKDVGALYRPIWQSRGTSWPTFGSWLGTNAGWSGFKQLHAMREALGHTGNGGTWLWRLWGVPVAAFGVGAGIVYTAGRVSGAFPAVGEREMPW